MPRGSQDGSVFKRKLKVRVKREDGSVTHVDKLKNGKPVYVWFARVRYKDSTGQVRELKRRADTYADACALKNKLLKRAVEKARQPVDVERLTFSDLADHYEERYAVPAQYADGRKVAGLRSLPTTLGNLETLRAEFGTCRLDALRHEDIRDFRARRLALKVVHRNKKGEITGTRDRTIASVNRELALLRRMLNVAQRKGWIVSNPFNAGDNLISTADERKRERTLSFEEERRLLEACGPRTTVYERRGKRVVFDDDGERRKHLRAIIICALDTGMRKGEMLALRWSDVDLDARNIHVRAFNTKTQRERVIPISARLHAELSKLHEAHPRTGDPAVFGYDDIKRSFASACRAAGISGLRFHDLRHTAATRLVQKDISLAEVGRILGHTQPVTTYRYVNANLETMSRVVAALDAMHAESSEKAAGTETVN